VIFATLVPNVAAADGGPWKKKVVILAKMGSVVAAADGGGPWKKKVVILAKIGSVVATMRSFARNSDRLNNSSRD